MSWFSKDPLQIITFKTYGTMQLLYLRGRALEDEDIDLDKKGWFNLLINSWKRFGSDEVRNTLLSIIIDNEKKISCLTDEEGYFLINKSVDNVKGTIDAKGWLSFKTIYNEISDKPSIQLNNSFKGEMLIPKSECKFGVISDVDDTILHTGVASPLKWRLVINTFFKTPHKRKALEGSVEFYHLLHNGKTKCEANPIFYVSNSPWNLYRYLDFFLQKNNFPKGPLLLRDFRTPFDRTPKTELAHKYQETYNILNTYPNLKFILIGDCGEKDADIYLDVVKTFPNRIAAIYLRAVEHKKRMKRIKKLFKNYNDVPFLIVESTDEAVIHAKKQGFIA